MDQATQQKIFEDLGFIKSKLESIEKTNTEQNKATQSLDKRLRNQEIKSGGIAAIVAFGISLIGKGMGGGT